MPSEIYAETKRGEGSFAIVVEFVRQVALKGLCSCPRLLDAFSEAIIFDRLIMKIEPRESQKAFNSSVSLSIWRFPHLPSDLGDVLNL